jgi:hypothetical protein
MAAFSHAKPVRVGLGLAMVALPYDRLPGFVWPVIGILVLACAAAWACRFVVHQIIIAGREISGRDGSYSSHRQYRGPEGPA